MNNYKIEWGFLCDTNSNIDRKNKKRKFNDSNEEYHIDNKMIYVIGNELHFTAPINEKTIEDAIKYINEIVQNNKDNYSGDDEKLIIKYIVDSPGGCVKSILKFVDHVGLIKEAYPFVQFVSIISGQVASAGTTMCIIADKRRITKNASAMIHELSSGMRGTYTHMTEYAKHLSSVHDRLTNIYINGTSKTKEEIEELLRRETWFEANS